MHHTSDILMKDWYLNKELCISCINYECVYLEVDSLPNLNSNKR